MASTDIDRLSIDTIRTLSMDGVQKANSGHPGLPMAMAPVAYLLFARIMEHNPADPHWPDRDRFVLSAGHGSMLLYSVLHLSGYDLPLDELKNFRQWGSLTPGHPERDRVHVTPGVEITTGPLGQGFANGVGMAMAEHFLRAHFGAEVQNHRVFAIVSDGDLMEGIAAEAASLAGKLGLGRIVYLYDDNDISLDGPTELSFDTEDVAKRFEAYRWHVQTVDDANDLGALEVAIDQAMREEERPSLIRVKSIIGWPSPNKQGTSKAHGSPLGEDEVRLTKEILGWDPDEHFVVPDEVREHFDQRARGAALQAEWEQRFRTWRDGHDELAAQWDAAWAGKPLPGVREALQNIDWGKDKLATRSAGQQAMAAFSDYVPTMVGGAADLSESTKTEFPGGHELNYKQGRPARNVFFGVREHGMGGVVNGMAGHGGIVRPYGSTFLQFADYMRGSIRLSALMGLEDAWVYTHDSVGLGEDGPDPPARRAPRGAARDPGPRGHPPRRRQRDRRRVAHDPRGPRRARGADPLAPGPAGPPRRRLRRRGPRRLRAARRRRSRGGVRRHRVRALGRHRGGRAAELPTACARGSSRCRRGSSSPPRTTPTATRCCRPGCPPWQSRRACLRGGSAGWTAWWRSTASARARPGPWSSRSWGSRPRTPRAPRASSWAR